MSLHHQPTTTTPRPFMRATAERCAHCRRELPTGQGTDIPGVGVVGPECARRYAPLAAAIAKCQNLRAYEWDQGSIRLAHTVIMDLRRVGFTVTVVDVTADTKEVQIGSLTRKPSKAIETWEEMRAKFEQRLRDAQAEREAQDAEQVFNLTNPVTGTASVPYRIGGQA